MVVRRAGQSVDDFAAHVVSLAGELAPVRVSFSPYSGLDYAASPSGSP